MATQLEDVRSATEGAERRAELDGLRLQPEYVSPMQALQAA